MGTVESSVPIVPTLLDVSPPASPERSTIPEHQLITDTQQQEAFNALSKEKELEIANVGTQQQKPSTSSGTMPSKKNPVAALEVPDTQLKNKPEITGYKVKLQTVKDWHQTAHKLKIINVSNYEERQETLKDEQQFTTVLGYIPNVTLQNSEEEISKVELFHHFLGVKHNQLKHVRIHFCYHLFDSVFLIIVKGRLAMLKNAHGVMILNDAKGRKVHEKTMSTMPAS